MPEDFFLDMLDEQFSEEESRRQMETAVAWGRYAELFDYDAGGGASFSLTLRKNSGSQRGSRMNLPHPLARSLVTARTWPFVIDVGVAACGLAIFFSIISTGEYWLGKPVPVIPISHSIGALPAYAFYSLVRMAIAYIISLVFAIPTATSPPTARESKPG